MVKIFVLSFYLISFCGRAEVVIDSVQSNSTHNTKGKVIFLSAASGVFLVELAAVEYIWYKNTKLTSGFHFYNDNNAYLQMDKFAHAFGGYLGGYIGYAGLRSVGVSRKKSLIYGTPLGFLYLLPVEIFDGAYKKFGGFSWGDIIANGSGTLFFILQEYIWQEQKIIPKLSYYESEYANMVNGALGKNSFQKFFFDYNAQTYWISAPFNIFSPKIKPAWINFAIGYSANGMVGEYENYTRYGGQKLPEFQRYRQFLFSLDINWIKIPTRSRFLKKLFQVMVFVKLPFPTLEYNSLGNFRFYWLYY
ncbi:MAG: DUF2279 domain-containing protein [Chitinophagaceae bacterium]|nr:DUF2279 domain-containing protein [Chitinophagaceae bacterium]